MKRHPQEKKAHVCPSLGVITVSLSAFQDIMGFVWLIYPACRQHYPDSHTGLRSKRGRCAATRVGLIKFTPTNKGMADPIIQPGQRGHCLPVPARKCTNLIIVACFAPIIALVALRPSGAGGGEWRGDEGLMGSVDPLCPWQGATVHLCS